MDDSDSDLSSLSSAPSIDDAAMEAKINAETTTALAKGLDRYFKPAQKKSKKKDASPEPPKRAPSPPHEYVLADNGAIAFLVMFRSRFTEVFAKSLPHYGPQDIEFGVSSEQPDEGIERLLCALLDLVANRKKPVERGHYGRALEDAISEHKSQWPKEWAGTNPLSGGKTFVSMSGEERLLLLKTLVLWALHSSDAVNATIKGAYKQSRRDDDRNQPKAIQPWFSDTWRRKYYLIEGQDDTQFRIYRENDGKTAKTNQWFSVAGSIDEAKSLAEKLQQEMPGNQARIIADKINMAVPRWEAGDEKRRRKEYRQARKAAFQRPEPGFSLYEGRTRGKRMRYTFEDENDFDDDTDGLSRRNRSGASTPFDEARPTVTASGRQVKSRLGGMYGESMLTDQRKEHERNQASNENDEGEESFTASGRPARVRPGVEPRRAAPARGRYADGLDSESESDAQEASGDEWSGNEDEPDDEEDEIVSENEQDSDDELMDDAVAHADGDDDNTQESLVVQLRYRKKPSDQSTDINGLPTPRESTPLRNANTAAEGMLPQVKINPSQPDLTSTLADPNIITPNSTKSTTSVSELNQLDQREIRPELGMKVDLMSQPVFAAPNGSALTKESASLYLSEMPSDNAR